MEKITFLGTSGAAPTPERSMPSIAVKWAGSLFLWDCGEGAQRQMMRFGTGFNVDAIFITHLHLDHFLGVYGLLETLNMQGEPKPLTIFAPKGFEDLLINKHGFVTVKEMKTGELFKGKDFTISAFKVRHGGSAFGLVLQEDEKRRFYEEKAKKVGIKGRLFTDLQKKGKLQVGGKTIHLEDVTYVQPGRKIVYTGDTLPCEEVVQEAKGADLLIHECTFDDDRMEEAKARFHTTAEDAARIAKEAGAKKLMLTHFSPRYPDSKPLVEKAKTVFRDTAGAYDGLEFEI